LHIAIKSKGPKEASSVPFFEKWDPITQEKQLAPPILITVFIESLIKVPLRGIL
jgi:hypothetical protein